MRRINAAARVPDRIMTSTQIGKDAKLNEMFAEKVVEPPSKTQGYVKEQKTQPLLTVYVAHYPACKYSEDLVALADECGIEMQVYDVQQNGLPVWNLPGVPTIETVNKEVYCGDAAFEYILELAKHNQKDRAKPAQGQNRAQQQYTPAGDEHDDVVLPRGNRMMNNKASNDNRDIENQQGSSFQETLVQGQAPEALQVMNDGTGGVGVGLDVAFAEGERLANIADSYSEESGLTLQQLMDSKMSARS